MIETGDLRKGITLEIDGTLYTVLEVSHLKLGRGTAQVRMKLRNVRKGDTIERTVQAGERFTRARLDHRDVQFLYREVDHYHFMDTSSYEQLILDSDQLGDVVSYLTDGMIVQLNEYQGEAIGVEIPANVVLRVSSVEFGVKGDTATGAMKRATLETGLVVNVPLFVNEGDKIRVDTRTGEYQERA